MTIEEIELELNKQECLKLRGQVDSKQPLKDFLIDFFDDYNSAHDTVYETSGKLQTLCNRRRSLGDIYLICKYYYPECRLIDVVYILYKIIPVQVGPSFCTSYCNDIKKRVYRKYSGHWSFILDFHSDEYGNSPYYYLEQIENYIK